MPARPMSARDGREKLKNRVQKYILKNGPNDHSGSYFWKMAHSVDHSVKGTPVSRMNRIYMLYKELLMAGLILPMP